MGFGAAAGTAVAADAAMAGGVAAADTAGFAVGGGMLGTATDIAAGTSMLGSTATAGLAGGGSLLTDSGMALSSIGGSDFAGGAAGGIGSSLGSAADPYGLYSAAGLDPSSAASSSSGIFGSGISGSDLMTGANMALKAGSIGMALAGSSEGKQLSADLTNEKNAVDALTTDVSWIRDAQKGQASYMDTLSNSLISGSQGEALPAGIQGGITAASDASKAALSGTYNKLGLGNSTMAAQGTGAIENAAAATAAQYRTTMLSEGLTAAGLSAADYKAAVGSDSEIGALEQELSNFATTVANFQAGQDQAMTNALSGAGGGGGGGGGSVICTQLSATAGAPLCVLSRMRRYGRQFPDARYWVGYHAWAKPYVRLMRQSATATAIARHVVTQIGLRTPLGRVYGPALSGISWCVGAVLRPVFGALRHG